MPKPASGLRETEICAHIGALLDEVGQYLSPERAEQTIRKWIAHARTEEMTEDRLAAMTIDAATLATDLWLSQPSQSGSTAFDRLARGMRGADGTTGDALAALRQARFRLLLLAPGGDPDALAAHDILSGEALRILGAGFSSIETDTPLFCRIAMVGHGMGCLAGLPTPLDPAALAVATGHPSAGKAGAAAGVRWAEAVYRHVVQNGTLELPGINRLPEGFEDEEGMQDVDPRLIELVTAWTDLEGGEPDAELLLRTRQLVDMAMIIDAIAGAWFMQDIEGGRHAAAVERMLLVQLDVVLRRERSFSGGLTLDAISQALDDSIAVGFAPAHCKLVFETLRKRLLARNSGGGNDPALERLVGVIQGLRAKTVAQGCTEHEAVAAAEKVAELLDRYGLSLGELDFEAQSCEGIGIQTSRRRFAPIDSCMNVIAEFFDCRVWAEQPAGAALRYVFFGLRGDVAATHYLYDMVERAFETETKTFRASPLYAQMAGERRAASNSFQVGLAKGICKKLETLRAARTTNLRHGSGRDLVPMKAAMVDDELGKLGLSLRQRSISRGSSVLLDAFEEGEAAGRRFEVMQPIGVAA